MSERQPTNSHNRIQVAHPFCQTRQESVQPNNQRERGDTITPQLKPRLPLLASRSKLTTPTRDANQTQQTEDNRVRRFLSRYKTVAFEKATQWINCCGGEGFLLHVCCCGTERNSHTLTARYLAIPPSWYMELFTAVGLTLLAALAS